MFSNENRRQSDACRFCWMCRHICPVAGATGNEGWTPRARALMISLIERGQAYTPSLAEAMYHCSLCDACANDCVTGFRPTDFIREARTLAVVEDIAPPRVMWEIENLLERGSVYGEPADAGLLARIRALPEKADVLLYLGQTARIRHPATAMAVMDLLEKAGVSYTALADEAPSGAMLAELMGWTGEVQELAARNADAIAASSAKEIVALSPLDAEMMIGTYPKWSFLPGLRVTTASAFVAGLLRGGRLTCRKAELRACLQEPVKLTRGLDETRPLLEIVEALSLELVPFFLNGKMSRCIGTPALYLYDAAAVGKMVAVRLDDARRLKCACILSASPEDAFLFEQYPAEDVRCMELYILLNEHC